MDPSGSDDWHVEGNVLYWDGRASNGRAVVSDANLSTAGILHAAVAMEFPDRRSVSDGIAGIGLIVHRLTNSHVCVRRPRGSYVGPTSLLLRFDASDKSIGPGPDDWRGYECALNPASGGVATLGYHDHM